MMRVFERQARPEPAGHTGTALVPYVIEPDEICAPLRPAHEAPAKVVPYVIEVERIKIRSGPRRRAWRVAAGVVALVVLVVATAATLMSAPRVATPALPGPPSILTALPSEPSAPLETKELPVVVGFNGLTTTTDSLFAGPAQFSRAMLVRTDGRMSMAFEMTAEPGKATFQTVSPTVLEIEAGPTIGPIRPAAFVSSALPLLNQLSIRKIFRDHREYLQARVMLNAAGGADVRVVGRVVYVDLAPMN